ncbi:MAG TPA: hypothetical protein VF168_01440 [Trueperaceae bacterium]
MLIAAFILTALYAVVNAVGAWAVIRRKGWLAALFMLAASVLIVSAAAMVSALPFTMVLLAIGLVLASVSSLLYGRLIIGRVKWHHHLVRAAFAVLLFLLAYFSQIPA